MSWLFSRALVAEYLGASSLDGGQSVQSNSTPMPQAYLLPGKTMDAWTHFPSGMTCEPLMANLGKDVLTSFRAGSRVKTSVRQGKARGLTDSNLDSGKRWPGSLAKYDHDSRSWRTPQRSLFGGWGEFSGIFPRWGSMHAGRLFPLRMLEHNTSVKESGSLPTPRKSRGFTNPTLGKKRNDCLTTAILGEPVLGMRPVPEYTEWMMDWPIGWSDMLPLEMGKFQQWLHSHGDC